MINITMVSLNKFTTSVRGHNFTIERMPTGIWWVIVVNASVHAYNGGVAMPKEFDTLEEVEARYKSLRGISELVSDLSDQVQH